MVAASSQSEVCFPCFLNPPVETTKGNDDRHSIPKPRVFLSSNHPQIIVLYYLTLCQSLVQDSDPHMYAA